MFNGAKTYTECSCGEAEITDGYNTHPEGWRLRNYFTNDLDPVHRAWVCPTCQPDAEGDGGTWQGDPRPPAPDVDYRYSVL